MLSDLEIAQATPLKRIGVIAAGCGIQDDELEPYGHYKAKIRLDALERLRDNPNGKYIDVTAITPTPLGEGKTVTTIGLSLGLNKLGKRSFACLRQPSMGPTFGIKARRAAAMLRLCPWRSSTSTLPATSTRSRSLITSSPR